MKDGFYQQILDFEKWGQRTIVYIRTWPTIHKDREKDWDILASEMPLLTSYGKVLDAISEELSHSQLEKLVILPHYAGAYAVYKGITDDVTKKAIAIQPEIVSATKTMLPFTCSIAVVTGRLTTYTHDDNTEYIGALLILAASLCKTVPDGSVWVDEESRKNLSPELRASLGPKRNVHIEGFRHMVDYYQIAGSGDSNTRPKPESASATLTKTMSGTVRKWNESGNGFIYASDDEFFYTDRRFVVDNANLSVGERVHFLPRDPLQAGKNRVAACVVRHGQLYQGKISQIIGQKYGFWQLFDSMGNLWSMFVSLGANEAGISVGNQVVCKIVENEKGPCAEEPRKI